MQTEVVYQKELVIKEGDTKITGFGVLPSKKSYSFTFESETVPQVVRVNNCHRDEKFKGSKVFKYDFKPSQRTEYGGNCILSVSFIDPSGSHRFGAVTFIDDETLPARLECNGVPQNTVGVSSCQAKSGTIQAIDFSVKVHGMTQTAGCEQPINRNGGREWDITISDDFCLYVFRAEDKDFHRLTTFGYNETYLK